MTSHSCWSKKMMTTFLKNHRHTSRFVGQQSIEWQHSSWSWFVCVSCDLKWSEDVDAIVSKAASRLHFLKQLKRADTGAPIRDLLHFYIQCICSTAAGFLCNYACQVWHSIVVWLWQSPTRSVSKSWKCAISMIYSGADYETSLIVVGLSVLRRLMLTL